MTDTARKTSTERTRKHRAATGWTYDRAYGRAARKVVRVFQREHPDQWAALLAEELVTIRNEPTPDA